MLANYAAEDSVNDKFCSKNINFQTRRHGGGAFRGHPPPQITTCALPLGDDCASKESKRPDVTGVHFWACALLQKILLMPS